MKKSEQLDWLGSDVAILSSLVEDDGNLKLPGSYMPDGKPLILSMEGVEKMTAEVRQRIVSAVRGEYGAREESQNAQKRVSSNPSEAARRGDLATAQDGRGGTTPATPPVQEREVSLLETLLAKKDRAIEGLAAAQENLEAALEWHKGATDRLVEIELCINALQNELPATSKESEDSKVSKQHSSGSTKGSGEVSRQKTTSKS